MTHLFDPWWTELRDILSDRAVLLILLGGTLLYGFAYPLPYRFQVVNDLPVVLVDHDRSSSSRQLGRMLNATPELAVAWRLTDRHAAENLMRSGQAAGLVEIPAGFERDMLRGTPVKVGVWGNAAYMLVYSRVGNAASQAVGLYAAGATAQRQQQQGSGQARAMHLAQPVALDIHELYNPGGGYGTYVVPAVLMLILQQTGLIAVAMTGVGQRRRQRYLGPEYGVWSITLARLLAWLPLQLVLLWVFLVFVYGIYDFPSRAGSAAMLWLLLPFLLATTALGMAMTALFRSRESALQILMLLSVPILFLAGFAWPAELMPALLSWLGWLFPSTPAIDLMVRSNQMGASFAEVQNAWLWCWALTLAYAALAAWQLHRRRIRANSFNQPG